MSSSWFSLSLPNPFTSDDDDNSPPPSPTTVKPDFSLITQTIGRQLHNVASFLAPPPHPSSPTPPSDDSGDVSPSYRGIKNDLAEIGGSLKNGLSLLSSNKAVSEISKFASNLLQFDKGGDDLEEIEGVGISDDVVDFVGEISLRPECWIDFPLSLQHKEFSISEGQKDHASAMEQLVPSLTSLRHKIQSYMSEEQFWVIYFVLLLPRLNEDDYRLLSTPEVVQVREVLLQKLGSKTKTPSESSEDTRNQNPENRTSSEKGCEVKSTEQTENRFQAIELSSEHANEDSKLSQEHHEDDVSFSDLEDEDNDHSGRLSGTRQTRSSNPSSASESGDWIRLSGTQKARHSESGGSSDWLAVEDVDL